MTTAITGKRKLALLVERPLMSTDSESRLRRRVERERKARKEAEQFAEQKTREIYEANQKLNEWNRQLEGRIEEATQELRNRTRELRDSHTRLAKALTMRDEFIASISHELRSPLHAVLGLTEALIEQAFGPITEEQSGTLETIYSSGEHLLSLINDLLDLSRLGAGKATLERQAVEVREVSQTALDLVRGLAEETEVRLELNVGQKVSTVFACPRRLKQMLVNLLTNAIKFSQRGTTAGLEVNLDEEREAVMFTIWDNGIGIAKSDFSKLFSPFTQLEGGLDREYQGSGLGLMLVLRMAELHGGSVTVQSEPDQGSRFTINLPQREGQDLALEESEAGGPMVLLVDDSEVTRTVVRRHLSKAGYRVEEAVDGIEGLELSRQLLPDVILMDIHMPKLGGLDAIRLIRADSRLQQVPILAVTGLTYEGDRERCLNAGASDYLEKPVYPKRLLATLANLNL